MSNGKLWEDREDKTLVGRQSISISRYLLSSLSSLSSLDIPFALRKIILLGIDDVKINFSSDPSVLWEDREDREDRRSIDNDFLVNRWEDRFRALNPQNMSKHIVYRCLPTVFPLEDGNRIIEGGS